MIVSGLCRHLNNKLWPLKPMEKKNREPGDGCRSSANASGQASVTLEPGLLECCVSLGSSIIFLVLQAQYVLNYGKNIPPSPMMGSGLKPCQKFGS
ncbi:hypothetical protein NC652_021817 [Populus alba x Populus x berolinensis]|nr:hypothetical protein NC652_021817 [Populus alba x Populus x berolinensis]